MNYTVNFDDGRFLGHNSKPVTEYPEALIFTSKRKAEIAASKINLPSTVETATEESQS